jgi:hypothetical protein
VRADKVDHRGHSIHNCELRLVRTGKLTSIDNSKKAVTQAHIFKRRAHADFKGMSKLYAISTGDTSRI